MKSYYKYFAAALFVGAAAAAKATDLAMPPVAPSHLNVRPLSDDAVALRWYDNSGNELGFAIQRSSNGRDWRQIGLVNSDQDFFEDRGLDPATRYHYRVAAFNRGGRSGFSQSSLVQTYKLTLAYPY